MQTRRLAVDDPRLVIRGSMGGESGFGLIFLRRSREHIEQRGLVETPWNRRCLNSRANMRDERLARYLATAERRQMRRVLLAVYQR